MSAPEFLYTAKVHPSDPADGARVDAALRALAKDGVSFLAEASGAFVLRAMTVERLDAVAAALKENHRLPCRFDDPNVAYREILLRPVEVGYTHKPPYGRPQFARVNILFEPNQEDAGNVFKSKIADGAMPQDFISGVEKGVQSVMGEGGFANFPVVDVKATLIDGAFHATDSSALAFEIAGRAATREALNKGRSLLMEPIMKAEVTAPEDYVGSVVDDLASRRGRIGTRQRRDSLVVVTALVPLANMFGYASGLASFTGGKGAFDDGLRSLRGGPDRRRRRPPFPMAAAMRA